MTLEDKLNATEQDALRTSTKDQPLSQEEVLAFAQNNPEALFQVEKISIPVNLTKAKGGEKVKTRTLSRAGQLIDETENTAKEGGAIDSRLLIDGGKDEYAKKAEKAGSKFYTLDDKRTFDALQPGETTPAHTVGGEVRQALVAKEDMYLATTWGEVQFVAKGGLVTFMGEEAIGNNNPCDLVLHENGKSGNLPLTNYAYDIKKDYEKTFGKEATGGVKQFLDVALEEDKKNPYQMKKVQQRSGVEK